MCLESCDLTLSKESKFKFPVEPTNNIKKIGYVSRITMEDGKEYYFTLTEMQRITEMFESWKKQFHWKPYNIRGKM